MSSSDSDDEKEMRGLSQIRQGSTPNFFTISYLQTSISAWDLKSAGALDTCEIFWVSKFRGTYWLSRTGPHR